jgi:D-psicose/D-tagatose/L-ribulose 3-epimerase
MNQLGVHMLVFGEGWDEDHARDVFERAAQAGYDLVEVLIEDPATADPAMTARLSEESGVGVVAALCGTIEANLSHADPATAARGEQWVASALPVARDMGATLLAGPTFSPLHRYTEPPASGSADRLVERYGRLADAASTTGVRLGLEALNRYESNVVNTIGEAASIVRAVGSPALFTHADVFHMNIEEGDLGQALQEAGDTIGYVHVTESNRGPLGTGNFDWKTFFDVLVDIGFTGPLTFESFSPGNLGPGMCDMLALWRLPWSDPDEVAAHAAAFMAEHLA